MPSKLELDLRGVGLPVCLLQCNSTLIKMESDDMLEILVQDPEVVEDLIKIIRRSQGRSIKSRREGDYYRIHVGSPNRKAP
jgi:TusA-related sulfurtransferase